MNVLKDKLWLHLVSSVTCFPFHTTVKVKISKLLKFWNTSVGCTLCLLWQVFLPNVIKVKFWKTSCDYTLCLLWQAFLFISLWIKVWKPSKFWKTSSDYTLCLLWQVFPLYPIVKVKVWKFLSFERQVVITPCVFCDRFFLFIPLWKWKFESP